MLFLATCFLDWASWLSEHLHEGRREAICKRHTLAQPVGLRQTGALKITLCHRSQQQCPNQVKPSRFFLTSVQISPFLTTCATVIPLQPQSHARTQLHLKVPSDIVLFIWN